MLYVWVPGGNELTLLRSCHRGFELPVYLQLSQCILLTWSRDKNIRKERGKKTAVKRLYAKKINLETRKDGWAFELG
jgi:hypothetical protein